MDSSQAIRRRLAENCIFLFAVNEIPGKPEECELPAEDSSRQLPVVREKQLAEDFAFISASTDDMHKVMAIGLEEDSDRKGMTIRLASNTGDLSEVKEGFESIANILQRAATRCMLSL